MLKIIYIRNIKNSTVFNNTCIKYSLDEGFILKCLVFHLLPISHNQKKNCTYSVARSYNAVNNVFDLLQKFSIYSSLFLVSLFAPRHNFVVRCCCCCLLQFVNQFCRFRCIYHLSQCNIDNNICKNKDLSSCS